MIRCPICDELVDLDTDGITGRVVAYEANGRLHPHPEAWAPIPLVESTQPEKSTKRPPLSPDEVALIRVSLGLCSEVAERFGTTKSTVYSIWCGKTAHDPDFDYAEASRLRRSHVSRRQTNRHRPSLAWHEAQEAKQAA